jgi:hypothetical protein
VTARRRAVVVLALGAAMASQIGCGAGLVPKVGYRLHGVAATPFGKEVTDVSPAFAKTFCATLTHLDPTHAQWGSCARFLEGSPPDQPAAGEVIPRLRGVILIGGIFSHCFEQRGVEVFGPGAAHLRDQHGLTVEVLSVGSVESPEVNAATIEAWLATHPGDYIAVGHSKGAVDLMASLAALPRAQAQIKALVSVAGAISGSRLVDLGIPLTIAGFKAAVTQAGLGPCDIEEHGGVASVQRARRYDFVRHWRPPQGLKIYSLVGIATREGALPALRTGWDRLSYYSTDQDGQMIAEEAIIPGAAFLGVAMADHWAVALPLSDSPNPKISGRNPLNAFPRVALLEAIIRYVNATL